MGGFTENDPYIPRPSGAKIDLSLLSDLLSKYDISHNVWDISFTLLMVIIFTILGLVFYGSRPNPTGTGWEDDKGVPIPWLHPNGGAGMPGQIIRVPPRPRLNTPGPVEPRVKWPVGSIKRPGFGDPGLPRK